MTIYCPVCLKNPKTALACHLTVNCSERIWTSGHYYKNKSTGKIETGILEWFPDVLDPTYSDIYMGILLVGVSFPLPLNLPVWRMIMVLLIVSFIQLNL